LKTESRKQKTEIGKAEIELMRPVSGYPALVGDNTLCNDTSMRSHHVTLSEPLSRIVDTQVKNGRFKDFSAAVQEAVWNFFVGAASPFEEYKVTPEEVESSAERDLASIKKDRKAGRLKAWKP